MLGKILGLASLGEILTGVSLTKKFMSEFIVILALTIVASVIAGALIVFGFYEGYSLLISRGLDPDIAALVMALIGLFVLLIVVAVILFRIKRMRTIPIAVSGIENAGMAAVTALRGFYKGWTEKE